MILGVAKLSIVFFCRDFRIGEGGVNVFTVAVHWPRRLKECRIKTGSWILLVLLLLYCCAKGLLRHLLVDGHSSVDSLNDTISFPHET